MKEDSQRQFLEEVFPAELEEIRRRREPYFGRRRTLEPGSIEANGLAKREKPEGKDRGFLWRLNSYWRYQQVDGGVLVECESLTLSRESRPFWHPS